jgi:hypothetical protein
MLLKVLILVNIQAIISISLSLTNVTEVEQMTKEIGEQF